MFNISCKTVYVYQVRVLNVQKDHVYVHYNPCRTNIANPIKSNKKVDASEYGGLDRVPHAYSMLKFLPDTELTDGTFVNLIILRNPWGRYEWTGPFSDNDEYHWSRVKDPRIRNLRIQKDEGTFVMRFTDWRRQFEALR